MPLFLLKPLIFLIFFSCNYTIASDGEYTPYPEPDAGYVTDHADLLNEQEELRLERWLLQVEEKSKVEIFIVTINSISDYKDTENSSIETFATALFNRYGIGNMPKNDGILLLIAKKDRKARIELGAHYAHNQDSDAEDIMQNVIIPQFKSNNYAAGITNGTKAIIEDFANMRVTFPWYIVWISLTSLACLIIGISCLKQGKRGWGYVFIGIAIILFLLSLYLLKEILKHSSTPGGSGGFGGGFSGGGGATGSW